MLVVDARRAEGRESPDRLAGVSGGPGHVPARHGRRCIWTEKWISSLLFPGKEKLIDKSKWRSEPECKISKDFFSGTWHPFCA